MKAEDSVVHAGEHDHSGYLHNRQPTMLGVHWLIQRHEVEVAESEAVGFGGCASIVRGTYKSRPVAVKHLPSDLLTDTAVGLLEKEAYVWSLVSRPRHPNIVRFIGASCLSHGRTPHKPLQSPLIITELLDTDLRQLCEHMKMPRDNMLSIFTDIAYGLCFLHEQPEPIIHRDVNPSNIFMKSLSPSPPNKTTIWRAKIGDFGSANIGVSSTSLGGGTMLYSAPETLPSTDNEPIQTKITVKADIFSYGVLLLEVVMGELPEDKCYMKLVERVESKWPNLKSLVKQCTEHNPHMRPSASQLVETLEHIND